MVRPKTQIESLNEECLKAKHSMMIAFSQTVLDAAWKLDTVETEEHEGVTKLTNLTVR